MLPHSSAFIGAGSPTRRRTVDVHLKIHTTAPTGETYEFTAQWFFDDPLIDQILAQASYSAKGGR